MAAIGIKAEDVADNSTVEIWPENLIPFRLFQRLGTQWNIGPCGPAGLNYASLPVLLSAMGIRRKCRLEVIDAIGEMEREALRQMAKN